MAKKKPSSSATSKPVGIEPEHRIFQPFQSKKKLDALMEEYPHLIIENTVMSLSEIRRFAADLKDNAALRAEAKKAQADKSHSTPLDRAVSFAASKGYVFTSDQLKEPAKALFGYMNADFGGRTAGLDIVEWSDIYKALLWTLKPLPTR